MSGLNKMTPGSTGFFFSKIIENSRHPSRHLSILFPEKELHELLDRYLEMSGEKQRVRLVAANITGNHDLVPELKWKR